MDVCDATTYVGEHQAGGFLKKKVVVSGAQRHSTIVNVVEEKCPTQVALEWGK